VTRGNMRLLRNSMVMLIACAAALLAGQAEYPTVTATADPVKTTVGVPVAYRVRVAGGRLKGLEIVLPEKRENYPEKEKEGDKKNKDAAGREEEKTSDSVPLYIIHSARRDDREEKGKKVIEVVLEIAYYRPGKYVLPEIEIFDQGKVRVGYRVPGIEVVPVNEKGEFAEIEPPLELGGNYRRLLVIIGALLLLAAAGFFIYRYIDRRRKEKETQLPPPPPPLEIFTGEVEGLRRRGLPALGKKEEFVVELSIIFRRYVSSLYGVDAMEMTRSEIVRAIMDRLPRAGAIALRDEMESALSLWDLSKFAEFDPSAEALERNCDSVVSLAKRLSREHDGVRV
jgi:hypothetical protein